MDFPSLLIPTRKESAMLDRSNDRVVISHPHEELQEGEVWFCNISDDPESDYEAYGLTEEEVEEIESERLPWQTLREGSSAYDSHGRLIKDMHPLFIQRWELELRGYIIREPNGEEMGRFVPNDTCLLEDMAGCGW